MTNNIKTNAQPQATAVIIDLTLFQEISKYLAEQRYNEVASLLAAMSQTAQAVSNHELEILMNARRKELKGSDVDSTLSEAELKVLKDSAKAANDNGVKHVK